MTTNKPVSTDKSVDVQKDKDEFEVEHLDPAKRSWYYDDNGVKRKKGE